MDSTFAMGHVVIRRKRTVVGDESPDVILFRCIQNMNPVYPYNTCYTGGETVLLFMSSSICVCGDCIRVSCAHFFSFRYCEAESGGPLGAAHPTPHSQRVPGRRLHLPGCRQTGLKCVTPPWTPGTFVME